MDDEHRQYKQPWSDPLHPREWIIQTECLTKEGIYKQAEVLKQQLEQGRFIDIHKTL
jgi:hypothetical protein